MSQPQTQTESRRMTAEEYLAVERTSPGRHEYVNGEVVAMTGASWPHVAVVANLAVALDTQLSPRGSRAVTNDLRVRIGARREYVYPDVVVVCGQPELEEGVFDTLLNPVLIAEVLSPATRDYDRREKWEKYRQIASLRDYLVLSPERPHVERYSRQDERFWLFSETVQFDAVLPLDSVGCTLALRDVYAGVLDTPAAAPRDLSSPGTE